MSYISYWRYGAVRGDVEEAAMGLSFKRLSSAMPGRAKLFDLFDNEVAKIAEGIEIERMQAAQYGQVFPVSNFLEFSVLSFVNPKQNRYRYRLEGAGYGME